MGYDITVYSLLEIIHKDGISYIKLAEKGRYTWGAEYDEKWDGDKRTKQQQRDFEDTFLEVDFIDSDDWQNLPMLIYKDYSQKHNDGEDDGDDEIYEYYNKHNFLSMNYYTRYNDLLDTKILDNISGIFYPNEDDEDYNETEKRYNIYEKGGLLKSKDDIISINKIIQKKWVP